MVAYIGSVGACPRNDLGSVGLYARKNYIVVGIYGAKNFGVLAKARFILERLK